MSDYLSINEVQKAEMLKKIGVEKVEDLYQDIPPRMRAKKLQIPEKVTSDVTLKYMQGVSNLNKSYNTILVGAGCYNHFIPPVVKKIDAKDIPHNAKISSKQKAGDGLAQLLNEYEKIISSLTGLDVTTSPQESGAVAAAKACLMCVEKGQKVLTFDNINPDVLDVVKTYLSLNNVKLLICETKDGRSNISALKKLKGIGAVLIQTPNFYGLIENAKYISQLAHIQGAKLVVYANPISLGLLEAPGDYDADVACGDLQPLGMGMNYGGSTLGYLSAKQELEDKLPGIVIDRESTKFIISSKGKLINDAMLSSREVLSALTTCTYISSLGVKGLKEIASLCVSTAHYFATALEYVGCKIKYKNEFFDEFVTETPGKAKRVLQALHNENILGGWALNDDEILWCCTEQNSKEEIENVVNIIGGVLW